MAEPLNERVTRLENLMAVLAGKQTKLDDVLVLLTEAQIETQNRFRETDQRFLETDQRFRETDQRFRETDQRFRDTDARIEKLVSAIGEFLRHARPIQS
jgi:hypothetical protein